MKQEVLEQAVILGRRLGRVLVATAGKNGLPHIAASSRIDPVGDDCVSISEWFCPGTLSNLQVNPKVSIVIWDPQSDTGFQLLGRSQEVQDIAMMDGLQPSDEKTAPFPQVERKILVKVERILHFSHAPHNDVED